MPISNPTGKSILPVKLVVDQNDVVVPASTSAPVPVADYAVHPGEDPTLDRQWGGGLVEPIVVSATASATTVITGACAVIGVNVNVAGTNTTLALYDGTSSSGTPLWMGLVTATFNVAGSRFDIAGGNAVYCATGLHAVIGGTGVSSLTFFVVR